MSKAKIFTREAQASGSGPEELDHRMVIVRPHWWIPITACGILIAVVITWSIFGRIPINVNGFGVLVNPGNVQRVHTQSPGIVAELKVRAGQMVAAGEVVATLRQPAMEQELAQAEENLRELKASNEATMKVNDKRQEVQMDSLTRQEKLLGESRGLYEKVHGSIERRYEVMKELSGDFLVTRDSLLNAESSLAESNTKMSSYALDIQKIELERERATQQYLQTKFSLQSQIDEARRNVERLQTRLDNGREIRARVGGRVLETMVTVGQAVTFGREILSLETRETDAGIKSLCYFSVKDGKKISPGMRIQVTPSTVKRERYGSIVGVVTDVSSFPVSREAAVNEVGSKELAGSLTEGGAMIEVEADLVPATKADSISPFEWTSKNPPILVSQGTTTTTRVTIERRPPITYVMPLLRAWLMGEKDDLEPQI